MSITNNHNYSDELDIYCQSEDICSFLNLKIITDENQSMWDERLNQKFAALDAAGFHLSSNFLLEMFFPSILRQFSVSRCSYEFQISDMDNMKNRTAASRAIGKISPTLPLLILPSSLALLAILFNISLLIVTVKKISLSTMCNGLLAFDSFCQIPALLPSLINLFAVCANWEYVDYRLCLVSLMLATAASYASFLAIYIMSLERFLIAIMPMRMRISERAIIRCTLLAFLACICFGVAMIIDVFNIRMDTNMYFTYRVYINIGFNLYSMNKYISHAILGLAILNYLLITSVIVWRRNCVPRTEINSISNAVHTQATNRMLRSVFVITIAIVIGWLIGTVLVGPIVNDGLLRSLIEKWYPDEPETTAIGNNLFIWLCSPFLCLFPLAAGINAPVLIINNFDYREAYKQVFRPFLCWRKKATAVVGPIFINHN